MLDCVGLLGWNNFKVFSLRDRLLVGVSRVVFGINVQKFRLGRCSDCFFHLGLIKLGTGMLVDFCVNSAMNFFMRIIMDDLLGAKRLLNSHL